MTNWHIECKVCKETACGKPYTGEQYTGNVCIDCKLVGVKFSIAHLAKHTDIRNER